MKIKKSKKIIEIINKIISLIKKFSTGFINNTQIKIKIEEIIKKELKRAIDLNLIRSYKKVAHSFNFNIDRRDINILDNIMNKKMMYKTNFKNFTNSQSNFIKKKILSVIVNDGYDIDKIKKKFENKIKKNINTIIRGETNRISMAAKRTQIKKTDKKYLYKHVGILDDRTSNQTKELMRATKNWVSWDKYISLAQEIAFRLTSKNWIIDEDAPILQPNQRSTFIFKQE